MAAIAAMLTLPLAGDVLLSAQATDVKIHIEEIARTHRIHDRMPLPPTDTYCAHRRLN